MIFKRAGSGSTVSFYKLPLNLCVSILLPEGKGRSHTGQFGRKVIGRFSWASAQRGANPNSKKHNFCLAYGPLVQDEPNRILAKDGNQPQNLVKHHSSVQFLPSLLLMTDSVSSSMFKCADTPWQKYLHQVSVSRSCSAAFQIFSSDMKNLHGLKPEVDRLCRWPVGLKLRPVTGQGCNRHLKSSPDSPKSYRDCDLTNFSHVSGAAKEHIHLAIQMNSLDHSSRIKNVRNLCKGKGPIRVHP